jgi:hypothetical protein
LPLIPAAVAVGILGLVGGKFAAAGGLLGLVAVALAFAAWPKGVVAVRAGLAVGLVVVCGCLASVLSPFIDALRPGSLANRPPARQGIRRPTPQMSGGLEEPDLVPFTVGEKVLCLNPLLAVAVDPEVKAALVLRENGTLDHYSYAKDPAAAFRLLGSYRLQQPGYRAVLDGHSHRLYVAASEPKALQVNRYGDRPVGRGDLHVYDVRDLLAGDLQDKLLRPAAVIEVGGDVSHLVLAPGRDAVYFLAHGPKGDRIERLSTTNPTAAPQTFAPAGEMAAMCLDPEGKILYAAVPGGVMLLDAATLAVPKEGPRFIAVEGPIVDLSADKVDRVFVAETGQNPQVSVLDGAAGVVRTRWDCHMHGRNYLAVQPEGGRLYLASSSLVVSYLESLRVKLEFYPQVTERAVSDEVSPVRGEFFITPDQGFLLTRWGRIYHLAPPEKDQPQRPRRGGGRAAA